MSLCCDGEQFFFITVSTEQDFEQNQNILKREEGEGKLTRFVMENFTCTFPQVFTVTKNELTDFLLGLVSQTRGLTGSSRNETQDLVSRF